MACSSIRTIRSAARVVRSSNAPTVRSGWSLSSSSSISTLATIELNGTFRS